MTQHSQEIDAHWLAGVVDCFGQIGISKGQRPCLVVRFKSPYKDRLNAIQKAVDGHGHIAGPYAPERNQRQEHYLLTLTGSGAAMLENLVMPRMRTSKAERFFEKRAELGKLRERRGPQPTYSIPDAASIPLKINLK